ncbi:MAG: hypothetical protein RL038_128, partial [Actinomycetota bacterium]
NSAGPVTVYDNLNDGAWKSSNNVYLAQSFTTDDLGGELSTLQVMFRGANESNTSGSASQFTISLRSSNSGQPGNLISTIHTKATDAWSNETYTVPLPSDVNLSPNTEYFIVMNGSASGTLGWKFTSSAPTTYLGSTPTAWTSNNGSTWSSLTNTYFSLKVMTELTAVAPVLGTLSDLNLRVGNGATSITPPTSNAAGTWDYTSSNPAVFTVIGSSVSPVGVGTATLTANFTPTDSNSYLSGSVQASVTVTAAPTPTPSPTKNPKPTNTASVQPTPTEPEPSQPNVTPSPSEPTSQPSPTEKPGETVDGEESDDSSELQVPGLPDNFFNEPEPVLVAELEIQSGINISEVEIRIDSNGLKPNSLVTATAYSDPIQFFTGSTDSAGRLSAVAMMPTNLEPNETHSVVFNAISITDDPVVVVGAVSLDSDSNIVGFAPPSEVAAFTNATEVSLLRAAQHNLALYDPAVNVVTTTGIVVAAGSLLALGGVGGLAKTPSPDGQRRNSQAKLAAVVTKKLKAAGMEEPGYGDLTFPNRPVGSRQLDALIAGLINQTGFRSAVLPRILVDGSWFRVVFGSGNVFVWLLAASIAAIDAISNPDQIALPSNTVLFILVLLSFIDSLSGAFAFITISLIAFIQGEIQIAADYRMLLGLAVLLTSLPLLVHVIRPLRRKVVDRESWIERVFDYVMPPVFVAFAAGSMLKALNGLSGLELVTQDEIELIRWAGFFGVLIRMAGEDIALRLFPQRCLEVHPQKLPSQTRSYAFGAILLRAVIFLFIATPFFGITTSSIVAMFVLVIPIALKIWEDDLPNFPIIHKWLPRGLFRFSLLLVIGILLSKTLLGENPSDAALRGTFAWLLLPTFITSLLELFGRQGGDWVNPKLKWASGAPLWAFTILLTLGLIQI